MLLTASVFLLKKEKKVEVCETNRQRKEKEMFTNLIKSMILEDHEGFFAYTRMTPKLIEILLTKVGPKLQKNPSKNPLPPVHRLLITLQYLSEGCLMLEITCGHYLGHSTVSVIIKETTKALREVLAPSVLKVLIVSMASCDAFYRFTLVDIGAAGGNHDSAIFSLSGFGNAIPSFKLKIPDPKKLPNSDIEFPSFFAANAAFPLHKSIMRPYPGQNLTVDKNKCNYCISRAPRTIEHTFGIQANRWRILRRPLLCDLETCENIVQACVVLHNLIQRSEL
ncbi:hypothetical protein JTB14_005670 [Gonioctena quinquepunctata]|nr:hypothetical protein JTB14_005670 [Gonioctena quinquepunctata]